MAADKKPIPAVRYAAAWNHHISELAALALAADISYSDWQDVKAELCNWLDRAVINLYSGDNHE